MKNIKFSIFFLVFFSASYIYSDWYPLNTGLSGISLYSIYFTNEYTGYSVGYDGKIIKTTNTGINWIQQQSNTDFSLNSIYFVNENTGFIVGFKSPYSIFLKTTNGGNNWNILQTSFPNNYFKSIYFLNSISGFITSSYGEQPFVLKTTNSGLNWTNTFWRNCYTLFLVDSNIIYTCGKDTICKSTNGGSNWQNYHANAIYGTSIKFYDINTGYCLGYRTNMSYTVPVIFKTTTAGSNWIEQNLPGGAGDPTDLFITDINTVFVVKHPMIYKTENGGNNWFQQYSNVSNGPSCIYFVNPLTGYAGCLNSGIIIKTTDGGVSLGIHQINTEIPAKYKVYQNYPNPFNPKTNIKYSLKRETSNVKITVFDIEGKQVEELVNQKQAAGTYEVDFDGSKYSSGVYFYSLIAKSEISDNVFIDTKKMILLK